MKKNIILSIIIVLIFVSIIGGVLYYKKFFGKEDVFYFCGTGIFGGYIEALDPAICEEEWNKIEIYKPICQDMVKDTDNSWESACAQAFTNPEAICLENMEGLNIALSEEQEKKCLEKVFSLTSEYFRQYIDGPSDCENRGGIWHRWSYWQDSEECDLPYPDGGQQCIGASDCISDECVYSGDEPVEGSAATGECARYISVSCVSHNYFVEDGKIINRVCIE